MLMVVSAAQAEDFRLPRTAAWNDLSDDQKRTLESVKKVHDYPIYVMTYHGDYGFDDLLKTGRSASESRGVPAEGCSAIACFHKDGDKIYGRNWDFRFYPILIIYTDPPNGYASVILQPAVFLEAYYDDPSDENLDTLLETAAYNVVDGMNEYGVCISAMYIEGEYVHDANKISLDTWDVKRLVLDYARNVEEAIQLLGKYNNIDSENHHYLIADAGGHSALIEYYGNAMHAQRNVRPWQVSCNSFAHGRAQNSQWLFTDDPDYGRLYPAVEMFNGLVDRETAMDILASVTHYMLEHPNGGYLNTAWTSIYDMATGEFDICPGMLYYDIQTFSLEMVIDLAASSLKIKPRRLEAGGDFDATVRVKNNTPRPSPESVVRFYLSKKNKLSDQSIYVGKETLPSVAANSASKLVASLSLKKSFAAGKYYLIAVIDENGALNDIDTGNNTIVTKKKVAVM